MKLGLFILASIAVGVGACQREADNEVVSNQPATDASPSPLPIAERPMDRAELLQAVGTAASAAALGEEAEQQRKLDGRRFEVRIRFGCALGTQPQDGAAASPMRDHVAPFNIRFDATDRTLRVRAAPDLTLDDPWIAAVAGRSVEAVEGFWMRRPWLLSDGCPAVRQQSTPGEQENGPQRVSGLDEQESETVSSQRIGLAQFFTEADSRTRRRDKRAYEATMVLGADDQQSAQGYNLVLSGRLRPLPTGGVITCRSSGPDTPPDCVVSAEFDRVRIERPDDTIVAEWTS
jgi:hypothetical protein